MMGIITTILATLVALLHFYIAWLETFSTQSSATARAFAMTSEELKRPSVSTLFKNQGVYNGLLAVLILVATWSSDLLWTRLLLGYIVLVAIYGSATSNPNIIVKQGLLPILALICSFVFGL